MKDYIITCTSTCDLTKEILEKRNIKYGKFKMSANNETYDDDFFDDYPYEKFYNDISAGMQPTTSQVGFGAYVEMFEPYLIKGINILHLTLSSAISGDYATCKSVADELNEKYEGKVYVLDTLGASSGYGMQVMMAADNKDNGMSFEDNIKYLEENKLHIHHWFISTDLSSYIRGGRISKTAGFFGTALKICPLMNMPADGRLNPVEKIRTKTKAMEGQLNKMVELCEDGLNYSGRVYISQSMMEEDVKQLSDKILETFKNVKSVEVFKIGTTIGAHTGPGTIALFFKGVKRV